MQKIIFLDIDGVLNSVDSAIAFFDKKKNDTMMYNEDRLDPVSIRLVQRACADERLDRLESQVNFVRSPRCNNA